MRSTIKNVIKNKIINWVWYFIFSQSDLCLSACSSGSVCLWEYKTGHIQYELDCRGNKDDVGEKKEEGDGFGVVKACCNSDYIIALLRDNTVQIWNRSDGYLSNILEMVCE